MNHLIAIDPSTEQEPKPYGYEFSYYMFDELPPITATILENRHETDFNKEGTQSEPQVENEEKVLNDKMQKLIQNQSRIPSVQIFWSNWLKVTWHLKRLLCWYTKKTEKLHPSMVIRHSMIGRVLMEAHAFMGHNRVGWMYALLKKYYYWKGLKSSVAKHIKCFQYQKRNWQKVAYPKLHFDTATFLTEFISMDLVGTFHPPTAQGNQYALTAVCMLTGYVFCKPLKTKQAKELVQVYIDQIYSMFGGSLKYLQTMVQSLKMSFITF